MQKNTVLGFVLIGLILIGFSWYNSYNYKKQAREAFLKDSLARVEALTNPRIADSIRVADSIRNAALGIVELAKADSSSAQAALPADSLQKEAAFFSDSLLESARVSEGELYTLENEKLKITFSSKGAQIREALVKEYYTYDSSALYMVKENYSEMSLLFFTSQRINTSAWKGSHLT